MKQLIVNCHPDITFMYMCTDVYMYRYTTPGDLNLHKPVRLHIYKRRQSCHVHRITVHVHLYECGLTCTTAQLKMIGKNRHAARIHIIEWIIQKLCSYLYLPLANTLTNVREVLLSFVDNSELSSPHSK